MINIAGLTVFAVGIVLLIFGFSDSQSFTADLARVVSGHPGARTAWMIVGGAGFVSGGLFLALRSRDT
jgi:hypothetical protein